MHHAGILLHQLAVCLELIEGADHHFVQHFFLAANNEPDGFALPDRDVRRFVTHLVACVDSDSPDHVCRRTLFAKRIDFVEDDFSCFYLAPAMCRPWC